MMEKEQVTRMQNSDLKELLEDVTLNEIHLSNEERQEMTSTFSQIIKKKKRKVEEENYYLYCNLLDYSFGSYVHL